MIELITKEYSYKESMKDLNWKIQTGVSKIAQMKELDRCFEYYNPINKKTNKPKKTRIYTKKLYDPVEPSRKNNRGGNNDKEIVEFAKYVSSKMYKYEEVDKYTINNFFSYSIWLNEILEIFNKEIANNIYDNVESIKDNCRKRYIHNPVLYKEYISNAISIAKYLLIKSVENFQRKNKIEYTEGYRFIYNLGKKSIGHFDTDKLNDKVIEYEKINCNYMNEEYHLCRSRKMKGRQLLLKIYANKNIAKQFKRYVCDDLMDDKDCMREFDKSLEEQCIGYMEETNCVDRDNRPLIDYHKILAINKVNVEKEIINYCYYKEVQERISNIIRRRARKKTLHSKLQGESKFKDKFVLSDIEKIEKSLFTVYDEKYKDELNEELEYYDDKNPEEYNFSLEESKINYYITGKDKLEGSYVEKEEYDMDEILKML